MIKFALVIMRAIRNASKRLTTFSLSVTKLKYNECNDVVDNGKFTMETFHWVSTK